MGDQSLQEFDFWKIWSDLWLSEQSKTFQDGIGWEKPPKVFFIVEGFQFQCCVDIASESWVVGKYRVKFD